MIDDLTPLYVDLGVAVTRPAGADFRAVFDTPTRDTLDVRAGLYRLRYPTSSAADMSEGEVVTIAGTTYTVAEPPERINDGSESIVGLSA